MNGADLAGERVDLRVVRDADVDVLRQIHGSPAVRRWWGDPEEGWPTVSDQRQRVIWHNGRVVGFVQWYEHPEPEYRHAGIDLFLDQEVQGRGLGRETVALVVRHLVDVVGHHRIVIDPAADNQRAIACYTACGFRAVGVLRRYERDVDGDGFHDGLLMELVVDP